MTDISRSVMNFLGYDYKKPVRVASTEEGFGSDED